MDSLIQIDLWSINKFCQYLVVGILLNSVTYMLWLILSQQWLKSYSDSWDFKANLDWDISRLTHSFSFEICDYNFNLIKICLNH